VQILVLIELLNGGTCLSTEKTWNKKNLQAHTPNQIINLQEHHLVMEKANFYSEYCQIAKAQTNTMSNASNPNQFLK